MASMRRFLIIFACAVACSPGAHAQFLREHVEGLKRQCFYRAPRGLNSRDEQRMLEVGFGEACPSQYHEPETTPRRVMIPSSALLRTSRIEGSQILCIYRSVTREYVRRLPIGRSCSITPY
jgi:hypothetical protein